jgi:hypothetical protein
MISKWFFCVGFVGLGMKTNVFELLEKLQEVKLIHLYVFAQTFDTLLTLAASWLCYGI